MRMVFGVLSLLVVVAIIGVLAKKQLSAGVAPLPKVEGVPAAATPAATPKQQVQQFQQAVEGAMQAPRPMPEEK
ncbi:MAG TPA: hypothetical protein VLJ58_05985 [Ramlibacter sp.]|nr:hypothetical protein [Ramlibacter sp.]